MRVHAHQYRRPRHTWCFELPRNCAVSSMQSKRTDQQPPTGRLTLRNTKFCIAFSWFITHWIVLDISSTSIQQESKMTATKLFRSLFLMCPDVPQTRVPMLPVSVTTSTSKSNSSCKSLSVRLHTLRTSKLSPTKYHSWGNSLPNTHALIPRRPKSYTNCSFAAALNESSNHTSCSGPSGLW